MTDSTSHPGADSSGPTPDPTSLVGTTLAGRYRIERRLGTGGMGAVYLGEHLRMGRRDAIKVMRGEIAQDQEAISRFTRGARAVARIHHPNVCQVYDFGETDDGLLYLAMEFIDGPSLSQLLADEGRLKPDRAIRFIQQTGEALHSAHTAGIIHRDLKPDNLMVARAADGTEQIKVVDFDIARGKEEEGAGVTRQGFVVGTPEYMSPEQLTGDPLDARSDVYSMALVLFRCLTGRLPFEGTTAQEVMIQRLSVAPLRLQQAAPGRTFPPGLEDAVHAALSKFPDERPSSARDFVQSVTATLGAGPVPDQDATRVAPAAGGLAGAAPADDATRVAPGPMRTGHPAGPPSAAVPRDGEAIPQTRVAAGATQEPEAKRPYTRVAVMAGGATFLVALLAAGVFILAPGPDAGPDSSEAPDAVAMMEDEADGGEDGEGGTEDGAADQAGSDEPTVPPATGRVAEQPQVRTPDPVTRTEPPPVRETPAAEPPAAGARYVALPADQDDIQQLLFRQYIILHADESGRADVEAARDTAAAVWAFPRSSRPDSAFAANIMGLTLIELGDSRRGVDWLETAYRLDPLPRYRTALEGARAGSR